MSRILVLLVSWLLVPILAGGQAQTRIVIRAARLIDGRSEKPLESVLIQVEGDKILSVTAGGSAPPGVQVVDLGNATVLPGFIDAHTHLLLHGDTSQDEYDAQLLKESIRTGRFWGRVTPRLRSRMASQRCVTWKPKERCTRM